MNFKMASNNLELDFEQSLLIHSNPQMNLRIFQNDRDPALNYFDKKKISNNETIYINETDIKKLLYQTQRFD